MACNKISFFVQLCCLFVVVTIIANRSQIVSAQEPEKLLPLAKTVTLFNEKNLNGWTFLTRNDEVRAADVWSVEDGVLKCKGKPSGYLQTKRWYRDYELNFEWRWPGDRGGNSGVLVHTTTPLLFFGWPKSLEVQLQSGSAGDFWVIGKDVDVRVENEEARRSKPKPGNQHSHRRVKRMPGDFEEPLGEWNEMRVVCRAGEIKVFVNGQLANHGTEMTVSEGAIAFQSEGTAIEFRDIRLKPLNSATGEE